VPKKVFHVLIFLFFFSAIPSLVHADNQTVFGPKIFEIGRWHVLLSVHSFNVEDPGEGVVTITKNTPEKQIRGAKMGSPIKGRVKRKNTSPLQKNTFFFA